MNVTTEASSHSPTETASVCGESMLLAESAMVLRVSILCDTLCVLRWCACG